VLGADQTLELDGECFAKAGDFSQAADQLRRLSGRKHLLHSAFCFVSDGVVVNSGVKSAELTMRVLSDHFISVYLDAAGPDVLGSVGLYQLEGLGVHLFESVDGDWFTILGLPLLGVVGFLRAEGLLHL
jgi:septum formation protein